MSPPIRRSGRARTANKKYASNDWDEDVLRQLRASSDSSSNSDETIPEPAGSDNEFHEQPATEAADQEAPDQVTSDVVSVASSHSPTPEVPEEPTIIASDAEPAPSPKTPHTVKRTGYRRPADRHSRGLPNIDRKAGKTSIYHDTFGPRLEDLKTIFQARDRWNHKARDSTFPSRISLEQALDDEWAIEPQNVPPLATVSTKVATRQQLKDTSMDQIRRGGHLLSSPSHGLVLGPWGEQERIDLPHLASFDFGRAWPISTTAYKTTNSVSDKDGQSNGTLGRDPSHRNAPQSPRAPSYHEGWLVNVGQKIRCLAWSQSTESTPQYLAIACSTTAKQRQYTGTRTRDPSKSPAFTPSVGYPSSIQIWLITSQANDGTLRRSLSFQTEPRLSRIFATSYGDILQVEWIYKTNRTEEDAQTQEMHHLVVLSTDGCVRVLGMPVEPASNTDHIQAYEIVTPLLCISPPKDLVFTIFALINESDIIIGGSDGSIRLYNLNRCILTDSTSPYLHVQLHNTYILKIVPVGTKELPYYIASTSAAGDLRLTDLRSPYQDFVHVPRTRIPSTNLVWLPHSQSIITAVDHSGRTEVQSARTTVVAHQFRHFYSQVLMMKLPNATGTASALAGSKLHPYILVGNTQGTVVCQNALRRILPRSGGWIQKLCEYEWIPQDPHRKESSDLYYGNDVMAGISRFHEGFQLEKQDLTTNAAPPPPKTTKPKQNPKAKQGGSKKRKAETQNESETETGTGTGTGDVGMEIEVEVENEEAEEKKQEVIAEVVFEQEQSVTKIAWNENAPFASWVAIGWGSGVVRIQDLSHDMK